MAIPNQIVFLISLSGRILILFCYKKHLLLVPPRLIPRPLNGEEKVFGHLRLANKAKWPS